MSQDRIVICMKWGTLYSAAYVNVLYRACRAQITGSFRFVCLTDDENGIDPEVECFPIPDMGLSDFQWKKGGWPKLSVFAADLYGLTGRALFIDLDTIICGPLDEMFGESGEISVIDTGPNWKSPDAGAPRKAGTGIFNFTLGAHPELLNNFLADPSGMEAKHRIEQVYVQDEFPNLSYWPQPWVLSFKYHLRKPIGAGLLFPPNEPPKSARVIAFHGEPRPIDLVRSGWWGIAPHLGRGGVSWAKDYWFGYGGD